jgi:hypothetical protein
MDMPELSVELRAVYEYLKSRSRGLTEVDPRGGLWVQVAKTDIKIPGIEPRRVGGLLAGLTEKRLYCRINKYLGWVHIDE